MDRALKERIIGAVVLVAFAILVVPVFLDGPADDADTVREAVTLPGQADQPRTQQTIVLERDRSEPVPMASAQIPEEQPEEQPEAQTKVETPPAPAPKPQKSEPAESVAASTEVAPKAAEAERDTSTVKPASATGMWAVQLGSFSNRDNAERLAADLRDAGYAAFLSQLATANGELHRVRIGPQENRGAAESVAASLSRSGHTGQVVPHP